jgi:hypothetical protein
VTSAAAEQRNPYKGTPPRPWIRLRFSTPGGTEEELQLLADTGNPCALILRETRMGQLSYAAGPDVNSNFGLLKGGWLKLAMPELGLVQDILGYASDAVFQAAQASSPDFEGLAGLPLLRLAEYGGNGSSFWLRPSTRQP